MSAGHFKRKRGLSGGFTLIELLVSSAVIAVVMMVLLSATSASLGIWRSSEQRISVDREARNGMAIIADDMANMLPSQSGSSLQPVFKKEGNDFVMAFPVLRPMDYQESNTGNAGDVCYVHYRYVNSEKIIYRSHADSKATFDAIKNNSVPTASSYEILAENVVFLEYNTYNAVGEESSDVYSVSLGIGVVDRQERENRERNPPINLPDSKTTERYFSLYASIPRVPLP